MTDLIKEAIAEIRNAHLSHLFIMGKLKRGEKTEVSALIECEKEWSRVEKALNFLKVEGV